MSNYSNIDLNSSEQHELLPVQGNEDARASSVEYGQDFGSGATPDDRSVSLEMQESNAEDDGDQGTQIKTGSNDILSHMKRSRKPMKPNSWTWETLAAVFSLLMTAFTVLTLVLINGKKLGDWPLSITPNTVISVLTTIARSSLLFTVGECLGQLKWAWFRSRGRAMKDVETFDEASRGPWGSLKLIWHMKGTHLASLGALVTVLALAADSFNQEILSYPIRATSSGNATIPYALRFQTIGGQALSMNVTLSNAIYQGLYGSETQNPNQALAFDCPTGNCTWASEVISLGICAEFANVTSELHTDCPSGGIADCKYSLPNGVSMNESSTQIILQSYNQTDQSVAFGAYDHFLSGFSLIGNPNFEAPGMIAYEYIWYFCAQSYNTTITNGVISQNVTAVWHDITYPASYQSGSEIPIPNSVANDSYIFGPSLPDSSARQTYNVSMADLIVLSNFLQNLTNGDGRMAVSWAGGYAVNTIEFSQPSIQPFYLADNVTSVVNNIAETMTNFIRIGQGLIVSPATEADETISPLGNLLANGTAFSTQTFIEVRWPWFILSLVLVVCGLAFLLGTVAISRHDKATLWKNSALALLMHGLDAELRDRVGRIDELSEMDDVAEGTVLRLQVTSDGLKVLSTT